MRGIEVEVLNPHVVKEAEQMMVAMARLTQRGHKISDMADFKELLAKPYTKGIVQTMLDLPHPTIQKFAAINVAVVGASRRFLAQITRHQKEVVFMSGSLQYSNYSDSAEFVVPYEMIEHDAGSDTPLEPRYLEACKADAESYKYMEALVGRDAAGYKMPQGMRNVLVISATPYQFKHMIRQRTCNRNTLETQYVMGLIWEQLAELSEMFSDCGPACTRGVCPEGKMCCGHPEPADVTPTDFLDEKYRLIRKV